MTFYDGYDKSAHLYDLFDTRENIDFFYHFAAGVGEILDIGAGTGRIAIPLAEKGIRVTCVEPSPAMRDMFTDKLAERFELEKNILLVAGTAATFSLDRLYRAAFFSGSFDHLLDDRQRTEALENVARHLHPQATLVLDIGLGLMKDSPMSLADTAVSGGLELRRLVGSKVLPGKIVEVTLIFETYSRELMIDYVEQKSLAGVVTRRHLHDLLARTGFHIKNEYSDYDFSPYRHGDDLLIIETVKT